MIDEKLLIKELNLRVRTKRSTMEIIRDIIPLVEMQPKVSEQEIRDNMRGQIIITPRKNEYVDFCGEEFYLDESKIISTPNTKGRNEPGYEKFRKKVLKRDGYSCQLCGAVDNLEVHHKKSYAKYPKFRTVLSNGITLCNSCHKKVHRKKVD